MTLSNFRDLMQPEVEASEDPHPEYVLQNTFALLHRLGCTKVVFSRCGIPELGMGKPSVFMNTVSVSQLSQENCYIDTVDNRGSSNRVVVLGIPGAVVRAARTAARVCDTFATPSNGNACALVVFDVMANVQ
jgi:hypothetical protein